MLGQLVLSSTAIREWVVLVSLRLVRRCCMASIMSWSSGLDEAAMLMINGLVDVGSDRMMDSIHAKYNERGWGEYPYELMEVIESLLKATYMGRWYSDRFGQQQVTYCMVRILQKPF